MDNSRWMIDKYFLKLFSLFAVVFFLLVGLCYILGVCVFVCFVLFCFVLFCLLFGRLKCVVFIIYLFIYLYKPSVNNELNYLYELPICSNEVIKQIRFYFCKYLLYTTFS